MIGPAPEMDDRAMEAIENHLAELTASTAMGAPPPAPDWFDELAYLRLNPDVAVKVRQGALSSGYQHYLNQGWREKRVLFEPGQIPKNQFLLLASPDEDYFLSNFGRAATTPCCIEAALCSKDGGLLVIGWLNDSAAPLESLYISGTGWSYAFGAETISRVRRRDVETAVGSSAAHPYGFFAFTFLSGADLRIGTAASATFTLSDGSQSNVQMTPRPVDDLELRNTVMSYLAQSEFFGNHQVEAIRLLDGALGRNIIAHNQHIIHKTLSGACVQYFGAPKRKLRGSIVVCLYGKPEYFFLQHALFNGRPGFADYELIYVSNSPELAERLMAEAKVAQEIYGVPVILVLLPGNAGFGAANNIAASYARTDRILIVNPDVFPRHQDWALRHTTAIDQLPAEQTQLFGAPLYYDDGSLMHGGMYFEFDHVVSISGGIMTPRQLARVEHYGKGAPPDTLEFTRSRPVQAVTGAFMSLERSWFERLGGFTEDFVFGHYEDADLCLKSLELGVAPWIHNIAMWHLEGKGSTRLPVHEGGSLVNRWIFTGQWIEVIKDGLEGQNPTHRLMQTPSAEPEPQPENSPQPAPIRGRPPRNKTTKRRIAGIKP